MRRVDAVVAGDELGLRARRGARAPRAVRDRQPGRHAAACPPRAAATRARWGRATSTCASRSRPAARARARSPSARRRSTASSPLDATFTLELNEYNGSVEPRLRAARRAAERAGADHARRRARPDYLARRARRARRGRCTTVRAQAARPARAPVRDRRGGGIAGTIGALVASGEPVLVVAADAHAAPAPPAADPRRLRAVLARRARARPVAGPGRRGRPRRHARPARRSAAHATAR